MLALYDLTYGTSIEALRPNLGPEALEALRALKISPQTLKLQNTAGRLVCQKVFEIHDLLISDVIYKI